MALLAASETRAATTNYRSIGTNAGVLYDVGIATVAAGGTTVNFAGGASLPVPTATGAVGPGDCLTLSPGQPNEEILFILSRDSDTQVTLQSPAASSHASESFTITRAFGGATALQDWEDARSGDLVGEDRVEVGVAYDDGTFTSGVNFQGATTDATRFMKLTVAEGQRHDGTASTGMTVDGGDGAAGEITVRDPFVAIEWLVVTRVKGVLLAGIRVPAADRVLIENVVLHDNEIGIKETGATANLRVRNTVVSGSVGDGIQTGGTTSTGRIENCTLYGNGGAGVESGSSPLEVENTLSAGNAGPAFSGSSMVQSHNVSSDGSASGTGSITGAAAFDQFVDIASAPFDLHLAATSVAIDAGVDLSASFSSDIDGEIRPAAAWDVGADERIVPTPQPALASAASQTFLVGAPSTAAEALTITDDAVTPTVTAANDLRLRIPLTFPMTWDTAIATVSLGGSAAASVDSAVSAYEDGGRTAVLDVTADFVAGDDLVVDGLLFTSFSAPAAEDRLELEVGDDGLVSALDAETVEIVASVAPVIASAAEQVFTVGDPPTLAADITIIDGTTPSVTALHDVRIRIPAGLGVGWDTSVSAVSLSGPAAGRLASSVAYEDFGLTVVLEVTADFAASESVTLSGLRLTSFVAPSPPGRLELELGNDDVVTDVDDRTKTVAAAGGVQVFTATARDGAVGLEWVNPPAGPYASTLVLRRAGAPPTDPGDPLAATVADQSGALGGADAFVDTAVTNDTAYHYAAWVNEGGSFSSPRRVTARPFDTSGPVKWAYNTGTTAMSPPGLRFQGGAAFVFAVSNDGFLHAMSGGENGGDWPSGWKPSPLGAPAQARPPVVSFPVGGSGGGAVFVGAQNGRVYAIDASSGAKIWNALQAQQLQAAVAGMFGEFGGSADRLLVGSRNASSPNRFLGLDVDDGSSGWSFTNDPGQGGDGQEMGIISGGAVIDYGASRVCFASREHPTGSNHTLWCLTFTNGSVSLENAWALGDIDGSPIAFNGRLYVGNNAGEVFALDPVTGNEVWSFPLGDGPVKGFPFPQFGTSNVIVATGGKITSLSDDGGSASMSWQESSVASPSTALQVPFKPWVYFGSSDGKLYQLDAATGTGLTSVGLGDESAGVGAPSFDILNGMVYVGTEDGVFYAVATPLP